MSLLYLAGLQFLARLITESYEEVNIMDLRVSFGFGKVKSIQIFSFVGQDSLNYVQLRGNAMVIGMLL